MAFTTVANAIVPEVYSSYFALRATHTNRFIQSGIVVNDPAMQAFVLGGGNDFNLPFWNSVAEDTTESNVSDDTTNTSTPKAVTAGRDIGQRNLRNQSWSAANVVTNLAGSDPLGAALDQTVPYWVTQDNLAIIQMIQGIFAQNLANESGDMIHDIYSDIASPLAANIISADAVIQTRLTSGDVGFQSYTNIAMHSITYGILNSQNLIQFIPNARAEVGFGSYQGLGCVVDDAMPVTAGTNSPAYLTALFGGGAFRWGEGVHRNPFEVDSSPDAGNGGGLDTIYSRRNYTLHPSGYAFTGSGWSVGGPSWAQMAAAASWTRAVPRKLVRMAFLRHNV
jgi:hypothetical protein